MIGITGATGAVGSGVAKRLAERDLSQRLIVRDLERAPAIDGAGVAQTDGYRDADGMTAACDQVDTLFLVSAHFSEDRVGDHVSAVDAALAAGVERIVYLSFLNAAPDATFTAAREHFRTEEYIRGCGAAYTFLRSSLYANLVPRYFGAEDATLRGPARDGRVSYVTRQDICDVAAAVLSSSGHDGQTYNMTGPEALSLSEVAALLSEISGIDCHYYDETMEEARASRAPYNVPDATVAAWISTYTAIANGELALVTDDIERLTGHPPQSLREYLRQHPESYQHIVDAQR